MNLPYGEHCPVYAAVLRGAIFNPKTLNVPHLVSREEEMWRWFLGLASAPGAMVLGVYFFLPESPRFLSVVGRHEEAVKVRGGSFVQMIARLRF